MGHTPNAENGMKLIAVNNDGILKALADQADVAAARLEEDRVASLAAIKKRHENELKAAKRNFKHRKKKIAARMSEFEKMSRTELADRFPKGEVREGALMSGPSYYSHRQFMTQLANADFGDLEGRVMTTMMLPSRQMGKSEMFRRVYGGGEMAARRPDMVSIDVKA